MNTQERHLEFARLRRERNPAKSMIERSRKGAAKRGLEFTITEADIQPLPRFCPVLGLELYYLSTRPCPPNAASLDRLDNTKGYTQGNVWVISYRANSLKGDSTLEEIKQLLRYMAFPPNTFKEDLSKAICKRCGLTERYPNGRCRPCQILRLKKRPLKTPGLP